MARHTEQETSTAPASRKGPTALPLSPLFGPETIAVWSYEGATVSQTRHVGKGGQLAVYGWWCDTCQVSECPHVHAVRAFLLSLPLAERDEEREALEAEAERRDAKDEAEDFSQYDE